MTVWNGCVIKSSFSIIYFNAGLLYCNLLYGSNLIAIKTILIMYVILTKQNGGSPDCCNKSQTHEAGAGAKGKRLYSGAA